MTVLMKARHEVPSPTVVALKSSERALQQLLQHPIRFVISTSLTSGDEAKTAPNRSILFDNRDDEAVFEDETEAFSSRSELLDKRSNEVVQPQRPLRWNVPVAPQRINAELRALRMKLAQTNSFRNHAWSWSKQHDAEEFYTLLVSAMLDSNRSIQPIIEGLFQHDLSTVITCPNCLHTSHGTEINYILGVRFEEAAPLEKLLRTKTFAKNILPGRHCDKCHTTADAAQTVGLGRCPDILVLQILRFRSTGTKKMARIAFNDELDLTPFTTNQTNVKYELRSVVHHQGTMDFGHYRTVAKGPAGWVEVDDLRVSRARINDAQNPAGSWTPYILFWTRAGDC